MSVDFTAFDAQVAGTDGTAGLASGNLDGGDGGNAIDALAPYSNTDFSLEPSLDRVFPTTMGGNGGAGAGGANATTTNPAVQGGMGRGASFVTMANDIFGSASHHYAGTVTITLTANGLPTGLAGVGAWWEGGGGLRSRPAPTDTKETTALKRWRRRRPKQNLCVTSATGCRSAPPRGLAEWGRVVKRHRPRG